MTAPARPHCEQPDACQAKGAKLCRRCNLRRVAKAQHADPAFAAAHAERSAERMRKLHADPAFAAANAERMRKLHADPAFAAANAAAVSAAQKARHLANALALGLREDEIAEWRAIRKRHRLPGPEAARIVIASRKGVAA